METRVAKLEVAAAYIQRDLGQARDELIKTSSLCGEVNHRVGQLEERLQHMPTTLGMWSAVAASAVGVGGTVAGGLWWFLQQYLAPVLAKAAGA